VIEGSEEKGTARMRIGNFFGPSVSNVFRWSLSASAPFSSEKEDEREIGDLSGLSAGSSATLEFGFMRIDSIAQRAWNKLQAEGRAVRTRGEAVDTITDRRIDEACEPYANDVFGVPLTQVHVAVSEELEIHCTDALFSLERFNESPLVLEAQRKAETDPTAREDLDNLEAKRAHYLKQYWTILEKPGPIFTFGTRLKASKANFEYVLDTDVSTPLEVSKTSGAIDAYLSVVYDRHLFGISYSRVSNYEAGRKTQVCVPMGTDGVLDCGDKTIGPPAKTTPDLIAAEWRYLISRSRFAISPVIEYDLDSHEWAIRAPLYAAVNKEGDLVGGLSVNWDSKDEDVNAVVFFGKKFSFFD
jgi:hypothetical protein